MNKIIVPLIAVVIAAAIAWYIGNTQRNNQPLPSGTAAPVTTDSGSEDKPIAQAIYNCDEGKTIEAAFYKGDEAAVQPGQPPVPTGSVKITLSDGRTFSLAQTISADGGRYANSDESFVFWDKGDTALVLENGVEKDYTGCVK